MSDTAFAPARRVMPHSLEAEASVIGGVLLKPQAFVEVADLVSAEDFYHPVHAAIFTAMVELDAASKPIDSLTVADHMRGNDSYGKLRAVNGEAYFAELMSNVVTIENIAFHGRMVRGKATVRRLIEASQEIAAHGYGEYGDVEEFIDRSEQSIFEIASQTRTSSTNAPIRQILHGLVKVVEGRYTRKETVTGVPSGFGHLDAMTAGWQPSDLIIVAARPSMGKTSLVMNAVVNAAVQYGVPSLVFSLEMDKESLGERIICSEGRIDSQRLRSGQLESRDWINFTKAAARVSEAPIQIDDGSSPTMTVIRSKARRWRANKSIFKTPDQLGLVVVDYMQLIDQQKQSGENTNDAVTRISKALKNLAKDLRVPVIALSQLNRAVESRADKRPMLSDLRESGAIEQDADVVTFIYRDEFYDKESSDKGIAEIIIAKQRKGPTGTVKLAFLNQYTRFENLTSREE